MKFMLRKYFKVVYKIKVIHISFLPSNIGWNGDLVVAYIADARLTTVTRREGYVSWGVYNIFLTPVRDWIHDCIRDWTRECDPDLNMSRV